MRFDRPTEPVSATNAVILGALVGAIVYIFDPTWWVTAGAAGVLAMMLNAAGRLVRSHGEDQDP